MVFYIYKIKDINYIGSTDNIKLRTNQHKSSCYNENSKKYNYLIYQHIREKQMNIELKILFCYKKKCSKRIQRLIEQFYINEYNSINDGLNSNYAFTNKKECCKRYNEKNKEKAKLYYEKNKARKKKYYEDNKERKKEYDNKYYQSNKEKKLQKIICPKCNSLIAKNNFTRHLKTQKCISAM